jgi:hypothetical protein
MADVNTPTSKTDTSRITTRAAKYPMVDGHSSSMMPVSGSSPHHSPSIPMPLHACSGSTPSFPQPVQKNQSAYSQSHSLLHYYGLIHRCRKQHCAFFEAASGYGLWERVWRPAWQGDVLDVPVSTNPIQDHPVTRGWIRTPDRKG